jgi:predicted glycosyl hydrolase (DUF1957 family)
MLRDICNNTARPSSAMSTISSTASLNDNSIISQTKGYLSVEGLQEVRPSTPKRSKAKKPNIPTQIEDNFSRYARSSSYESSQQSQYPTLSNYSEMKVESTKKTNFRPTSVTATLCAFCNNSVNALHMKEHLDSDCEEYILPSF